MKGKAMITFEVYTEMEWEADSIDDAYDNIALMTTHEIAEACGLDFHVDAMADVWINDDENYNHNNSGSSNGSSKEYSEASGVWD